MKKIRELLEKVARGELSPTEAEKELSFLPFEDLGFARLDHHRALRKHFPEVIYGPGKTYEQLEGILRSFLAQKAPVLVTRLAPETGKRLAEAFPKARYYERARLLFVPPEEERERRGLILILSGGTADLSVVEEARLCAEFLGNRVEVLVDVGVAGVHRLLAELERLKAARVIICVAGMEGALASLVAGLVDVPVIAVPTSAGYGAHFKGLAPLLAMLNSCAPGVGVVNIDNGFGAAYLASLINQLPERMAHA